MGRFYVSYRFHGTASETVEAESLEEAEAIIEAKAFEDDFDPGTEDIDDLTFKVQAMHPVTRDGREIWTTYVRPGDARGHQSAIDGSPVFAKEAALSSAAG